MRHFDMRNDKEAFMQEALLLSDVLALTMGADDFRDDVDAPEPSLYDMAQHARGMMRFARLAQRADDLHEYVARLRQTRLLIWLNKHMDEAGSERYVANEARLDKLIAAH